MHYAKIDFLIVIISIITLIFFFTIFQLLQYYYIDLLCGFVGNAFSSENILNTTLARKLKFLQKLYELIDF